MSRRMIVIGAGGVGGWLIRGLASMLEYRDPGSMLLIVDGDNFEPKNKERQDFKNMGNKAQVRQAELQDNFPQTFIVPRPMWVVEEEVEMADEDGDDAGSTIAASKLLQDGDVVYCVVDNFACRKVVFDAAKQFDNIDVFTGGNDEAFFGSIYHYQRRDGVDVTDHPAEWHPELINPPDRNPGELSCQERAEIDGGTQFIGTNMMVASWLLCKTHRHVFEGEDATLGNEGMFDFGEPGMARSESRLPDPVPATASI